MSSKYKTYKDYYHESPEFRKKQLERLAEKVECECGFVCARSNLSRHRKNHLHIEKMEKINRIIELQEELDRLKRELKN